MTRTDRRLQTGLVLCVAAVFVAAQGEQWPFGPLRRVSNDPVLAPQGDGWEAAGTFNPSVVSHEGSIVMLYRAQDRTGTSRLGYAISRDGLHFTRRPEPVLSPEAEYERDGGVEDPRVTKIADTYYLTYTAYNKKDAQLALATSADLIHWDRERRHPAGLQGQLERGVDQGRRDPARDDRGQVLDVLHGHRSDKTDQMGLAYSTDLTHWVDALDTPVLPRRAGQFDSRVVEPGPAPMLTPDGIVLIYNGADDKLVYRTGCRALRPQGSAAAAVADRRTDLRARDHVGEDRPGAERRVRRGHGPPGPPLVVVLRRRG